MGSRRDPALYRFTEPLEEGIVVSRPNRFIMMVKADGKAKRFHCPTTGRLGEAKISSLPCLFSRAKEPGAKTEGTVQAISFDGPGQKAIRWIGINQNAANRYVEFFLKGGFLSKMVSGEVKREVKLGSSRIDFLVGDTYLEVKTPLITLPTGNAETVAHSRFNSFDRLIRHMGELSEALKGGRKAILIMCYLYDADPFKAPARTKYNSRILDAAIAAREGGLTRWQVNLGLDKEGVRLIRYFPNDLLADG